MTYEQIVAADATLRAWNAEYQAQWEQAGEMWYEDQDFAAWFSLTWGLCDDTFAWFEANPEESTPTMIWWHVAYIEGAYLVG